ncbi:hypothetical protein, partial [Arcobacter sp. CECT 8985]|uniref:hypothetical protein n=1 Tax=Arcobacter sp. CECT 8985 TaxID=1935424 RepID=UPI00102734A6
MDFFNILYILINIILLFCAIYLIIVNSKKRKIYKQRAKELSQVSKSRECTQKEKELLKKYYHINIKDEKVCSTDCIFLEELTNSSNCDNNIINKRFIFNGAILICGLFFNYFYKRSKPKNFEYIVYKNNVYLVSVLFENSNVLHDLNMEHEFYYQYNVDNGLIEEGKYIITGFKASVLSLLVTISFLILLNFIDIKVDAILYVISMIFIYYSFLKDKRKSFIKYRKHNLTISIFTFINIILLLICLY